MTNTNDHAQHNETIVALGSTLVFIVPVLIAGFLLLDALGNNQYFYVLIPVMAVAIVCDSGSKKLFEMYPKLQGNASFRDLFTVSLFCILAPFPKLMAKITDK